MSKKIAILVRERQSEAFRMAVGLILLDDAIEVYVLDRQLENSPEMALYLETMVDLEMKVYSNLRENDAAQFLAIKEIARRLADYDHILVY